IAHPESAWPRYVTLEHTEGTDRPTTVKTDSGLAGLPLDSSWLQVQPFHHFAFRAGSKRLEELFLLAILELFAQISIRDVDVGRVVTKWQHVDRTDLPCLEITDEIHAFTGIFRVPSNGRHGAMLRFQWDHDDPRSRHVLDAVESQFLRCNGNEGKPFLDL